MADLLGREEFNRIAGSMFPNKYDADSQDVLNAELRKAQASGDTGAEASIRRDLKRVGTTAGATPALIKGSTMATSPSNDNSSSPLPEARFGLNQIVGDVANVIGAITAGNTLRNAASEAEVTAVRQAGQAAAEATNLQAESVNAQDAQVSGFLRTIGLDITDPNSALRGELAAQATTRSARQQVDNQIVQLESINFFSDPLNFLMAQPKLQALTAQYNQLARSENESDAEVARMQSISDTVVKLQPSRNADLVRKTAQANAVAQVAMAESKAQAVTAANIAGNAKMMLDTLTLKENVFARALQIEGLEESIRDRRIRQEDTNFYRDAALEAAKEKAEAKRKDSEQETALVTGMNLYRKAINGSAMPDLTKEDVRRMSPQQRAAWYEVVFRGNYGNKYSQSIPFISAYGNDVGASMTGNSTMMTNIRNVETRVNSKIGEITNRENAKGIATGTRIKHEDAVRMAYDELYREDALAGMAGSDKSNLGMGNPYAINFDAALANAVAVPNSVGPTVLKSMVDAKNRARGASLDAVFTPKLLLLDMESRVRSGEVSPKQASEETASFMALQSTKAYSENGLKYLNLPQPTDWNISTGATGKEKIDLMNPTKLERYFTAQVAAERSSKRTGLNNPFIPFR